MKISEINPKELKEVYLKNNLVPKISTYVSGENCACALSAILVDKTEDTFHSLMSNKMRIWNKYLVFFEKEDAAISDFISGFDSYETPKDLLTHPGQIPKSKEFFLGRECALELFS